MAQKELHLLYISSCMFKLQNYECKTKCILQHRVNPVCTLMTFWDKNNVEKKIK